MSGIEMADLTAEEARRLTERITGQVADLLPLIREAFERRAWAALGHVSWEAYCDAELRGLRLPVARRQEAARALIDSGMSQRSAAAALGVSHTQIRRDLPAAPQPERDAPVEPPRPGAANAAAAPGAAPEASHSVADVERNVPRRTATDSLGRQQPATRSATPQRPDLTNTPEARDAGARTAVRRAVQAFLPVVSGLTPERVAEVADEELWLELSHCRDRFIEWTDEVFAIRRRHSMRAVRDEAM